MAGAVFLGTATVAGSLYRIDWYPGLILHTEGDPVVGEVFEVTDAMLAELDAYEGDEYRRIRSQVTMVEANRCVWIWEWAGEPLSDHIDSGNWIE